MVWKWWCNALAAKAENEGSQTDRKFRPQKQIDSAPGQVAVGFVGFVAFLSIVRQQSKSTWFSDRLLRK
jgi:hypothetical protein